MSRSIEILHKYGAPRHYEALEHLGSRHNWSISYNEYTHLVGKSIKVPGLGRMKYPHLKNPKKFPRNARAFLQCLSGQVADHLVLGAEPYDVRVPLFKRIAEQNDVIFHTSWPFWDGDRVPRNPHLSRQRDWWMEFLEIVDVVTVTEAAKDSLAELGVSATAIPHTVDTDAFIPPEDDNTSDTFTVLFVGRMIKKKGISELVDVVSKLDEEIEARFRFVGDGPLSEEVETLAQRDSVDYLGYISDRPKMVEAYQSADVLVLPSYRLGVWEELFGIVLIEAMACGVPAIGTDCVGPREVIKDGVNGFIVEQKNTDAILDKIRYLYQNPNKREEAKKMARQTAEKEYCLERVSTMWKNVL